MFLLWVLVVLSGSLSNFTSAQDCKKRSYGNDGDVCVCNSNFCDTVPKIVRLQQPEFLIYTSNKNGLRFKQTKGAFVVNNTVQITHRKYNSTIQYYVQIHNNIFRNRQKSNDLFVSALDNTPENHIYVSTKTKYQKIIGWGGAFTDATGINIKSLPLEAQENLLKSYFSKDGIEYSLCRVPIGGTDFSTRAYSYDDGVADFNLTNFKLQPEDLDFKVPFLNAAKNLTNGRLKLFASAWTAPKWMKTNNEYDGFGFLKKEAYQSWANYFLKFLDTYDREFGITFWGITTGNEPVLVILPSKKINTVGWTPWTMSNWIKNNLGPTLRKSKHSDIQIMALDDQRFFLPWYIKLLLSDNNTMEYVNGIAVHWYHDFNPLFPPSLLKWTHDLFPQKFILGTEACVGDKKGEKSVVLGSWERGEKYADDIIDDVLNWVAGWVDWNMALNLKGGPTYIDNFVDSPIIVNATAGEFYKQPMYYTLGHFSKFVPPDSVRIETRSFDKDVKVVGFLTPDNGTTIVILNKKNEEVPVTLEDEFVGTATISLSAKSVTTILYWL